MNEWEIQNKVKEAEVFFNRSFVITVPQSAGKRVRPTEGQVI